MRGEWERRGRFFGLSVSLLGSVSLILGHLEEIGLYSCN